VARELEGKVRLARRAFILVPPGGGREVFDDYVLKHRRMAERNEPSLRFHIPEPGSPYPSSSLPAQLAQKGVDVHQPRLGDAYEMALFEAFFARSEDVSDPAVLERAAAGVGIEPETIHAHLRDAEIERQVLQDHREAVESLGITGIPTVVVPGLAPIVGAVPADFYREAFRAALEGRRLKPPGPARLPTL